jgi:hypothetical protein
VGRDWILHLCQRVPPGANAPTAQKSDNKIIGTRVEIGGKSVWIDRTKGSVPAIITRPYFPC